MLSRAADFYARPPIARGEDGFFHPTTESELVALVRRARRDRLQVRVRGSAHSVAAAIASDGPRHIDIMLDRFADARFDDERMEVTCEAGCHLGDDPRDPTRTATWERSLLAQLDARGWALPDLGGVTHQTVSGFLLTGSSGGSVIHSVSDAVVALRIVDGMGRVHDARRGTDLFDAVICSMGLLGIVTSVTFRCVARFDVVGREDIAEESEFAGFEEFLRRTEYARVMWWPQEGVRRTVTWQARRMIEDDYTARTGDIGAIVPKRYSALGDALRNPLLAKMASVASQYAGGAFYDAMALAAHHAPSRSPVLRWMSERARLAFARRVLPRVLREFVPLGGPQEFWDTWCRALPMDNQMSERALPTEFTEIWVPLDRTQEVMRELRAHYDRHGYDATGPYICELYAARATRGWMHPGFERDSLRVDLFWFGRNRVDPTRAWFVQFWRLLQRFGYRLHWGKYLPRDPDLGWRHLRAQTPRWDDFLALRSQLDPDRIFLTRYWRDALGLA